MDSTFLKWAGGKGYHTYFKTIPGIKRRNSK